MESLLLILKFFGGLFLLIASGILIGHIFKLDEYLNHTPDIHPEKQEQY